MSGVQTISDGFPMIPFLYVLAGWTMLFSLLGDYSFNKVDVLNSAFEKLVFVLSWPAFIAVMLLWRFCRDDEYDDGKAVL